jgi:hypothetical protein
LFSAGTRHVKAQAKGDADMPSQAMQDSIDALRDRRKASASQVYQLLLGTPEAAEATGRIGKFLRARVR